MMLFSFLALGLAYVRSSHPPFCSDGSATGLSPGFTVCTGVRGNAKFADDDTRKTYAEFLQEYDVTKAVPCGGTSRSGIPSMDLWGKCSGSSNTAGVPNLDGFSTSSDDFQSRESLNKHFRCLDKIWGSSAAYRHNGVTCDNIKVGTDTVVDYTGKSTTQNVVELNTRGDLYTGDIKGIHRDGNKDPVCEGCGIKCPNWQSSASGNRTGAILVTSDVYGPGTFKVRAMVPKTTDDKIDGRGYVFAIWMYHYEEIYKDTRRHPIGSQYVEDPPEFQAGSKNDGWYTPWVHEMDIEIPANSPQHRRSWKKDLGWNTMNMNTWIGDNTDYTATGNNFYQQLQASAPEGKTFISDDGRYHDYEFQWYVDSSDYTKNYVQFSFDGDVIWKSQEFIPTRPGRFNIGPWPAWWSVDPKHPAPDFDTATVKIASVEIIPQEGHTPVSFPETYDQNYDGTDIHCDFKSFTEVTSGRGAGHLLRKL